MGWSIGYDNNWKRDIGYGVPAYCDHPDCNKEIDRGVSYRCGEINTEGEGMGCGLHFCSEHLNYSPKYGGLCERCYPRQKKPFTPKPDHPKWIYFKMTDESWEKWRKENGYTLDEIEE